MSNAVWIVDDDRSIRWVLEKALAREGIEHRSFSSARDVLDEFRRSNEVPRVLVSDIRMPGESGLELLKEVIDLMKVNPKAAALALAQRKPADSSAAIDFVLANLQFQNGENAAAAETYEAAISKFPDFRRAHKNLGLLRVQTNDFAGGIEHLSKAIELGERDGRAFGLLGYCYVNVENYVAAEAAYRNAILQQPDVRDWQLGLARSLVAMEKTRRDIMPSE